MSGRRMAAQAAWYARSAWGAVERAKTAMDGAAWAEREADVACSLARERAVLARAAWVSARDAWRAASDAARAWALEEDKP